MLRYSEDVAFRNVGAGTWPGSGRSLVAAFQRLAPIHLSFVALADRERRLFRE